MREIKFRGKMISDNEWTYGNLVLDSMVERASIISYADLGEDDKNGGAFVWDDVDPKTIGQFIGCLDKNGKEIYEGDIVLYGNERSDIFWCDEMSSYGRRHKGSNLFSYTPIIAEISEIIGNLYEHPHLLNSEQNDERSVASKVK